MEYSRSPKHNSLNLLLATYIEITANLNGLYLHWFIPTIRNHTVRASFLKDCTLSPVATTWNYTLQSCVYRFCFSATWRLPGASPTEGSEGDRTEGEHTHTRSTAADTESKTQRNYRIRVNEQESDSTTVSKSPFIRDTHQVIQFRIHNFTAL